MYVRFDTVEMFVMIIIIVWGRRELSWKEREREKQTGRQADGWTDGRTDGRTDR